MGSGRGAPPSWVPLLRRASAGQGLCPLGAAAWICMVHLVPCVLSTANEAGGGKPEGGPGRQKGSDLSPSAGPSPRALALLPQSADLSPSLS